MGSGTISELIIAASVDPSGIRQGLDEGAGFVKEFAGTVERALDALPSSAAVDGAKIAQAILDGASSTFRANAARLNEDFFGGRITEERFREQGRLNAEAFNASLVGGLQLLRGQLGVTEANNLAALETLTGAFKREGMLHGQAYVEGVGGSMQRADAVINAGASGALSGMGRIRQGLISLVAQYTDSIPVLDRVGSQLLTLSAGGGIALAVVAGITAIAGAYHYATKEASELAEKQEKAIKSLLKLKAEREAGVGGEVAVQTKDAEDNLAALRAKLATQDARIRAFGNMEGGEAAKRIRAQIQSEYDDAAAAVAAGEAKLAELRKAAADRGVSEMVRNIAAVIEAGDATPALRANADRLLKYYTQQIKALRNSGDLDQITNDISLRDTLDNALHPKQSKARKDKDEKPFKDLTSDVGELTRAIDLAEQHGERAGAAIYAKLVAKRAEIAQALRTQAPGSEGANELLAADNDAMNALGLTTDKLIEQFKAVRGETSAWSPEALSAMGALQQRVDDVTAAIARQGGRTQASTALLKEQKELYDQLADAMAKMVKVPVPTVPLGLFDQLEARLKRVQAMEGVAGAMQAAGAPGAADAGAAALAAREQLTQALRNYLGVEQMAGETQQQYEDRMERIAALWDQLTKTTKSHTGDLKDVTMALHGVIDAASGLGIISTHLRDATSSTLHLIDAFEAMSAAKDAAAKSGAPMSAGQEFAGVLGIVGAAIGVVGALTSMLGRNSAALEQNSASIEKLRESLDGQKGMTGQSDILSAVTQYVDTMHDWGRSSPTAAWNEWMDKLKASGLSIDQINAAAERLGIKLDYTTASYEQLQEALRLSMQAAARFANTLDDQTSLSKLRLKVYGKDNDPAAGLQSTLDLLKQFSPKLAAMFDGIDTTTKEGKEQLRTAIQQLFEQMASGTLTAADYGTLGGAKELGSIIDALISGLNGLSSSVNAATAAMLYVPAGYKVALARFNATDAMSDASGREVHPIGGDMGPRTSASSTVNYHIGLIQVDAREQSPDVLFAAVLKAAQRRAQTQFGRTDKWSSVQTAA